LGIIESWMKNPHNAEINNAQLFAPGSESRLLTSVRDLEQFGDRLAAAQLLRAGTVRFHPWEDGENALDKLERIRARESIGILRDAVDLTYTATEAAQLSEALDRLGDRTGATRWARAAIQEDPCNPEGYLAIARSYLRRFRRNDDSVAGLHALRYLTKACQLRSVHRECLRSLAMLLLLLKAPGAAARVLRPLEKTFPQDPMVLALHALASRIPTENTSNIQELFLRWETGITPQHSVDNMAPIPCPEGVEAWELDTNRSLIATSVGADQKADTAEFLSVLAGTVTRATPRMGLGEFSKFTARSPGSILIGRAEPNGMIFCRSNRHSFEESLSRWLESDRGREPIR